MKLLRSCSGECAVCVFRRSICNPEDGKRTFTRASKEELIKRLELDDYTEQEKKAIWMWLKIQHV